MIDMGMDDAKNVVKMGPGNNLEGLLREYNNERLALLGRKQTSSNLNSLKQEKTHSETEELKFLS